MSLYTDKQSNYFSSTRIEILEILPEFSKRILEIGCGSGQTLEYLKKTKKCNETVGIELFSAAADDARSRVDQVWCMDVEKDQIPEQIGKFNLILLLDVLEHLVDPWGFLKKITDEFLDDGGKVIISLPNAQHFSFTVPLLFGRLDYVQHGIRDKTHLRFFTKKSAANLINNSSLKIERIKPTSLDFNLKSGKINIFTFGLFSSFLTSQYIFLCSKELPISKQ